MYYFLTKENRVYICGICKHKSQSGEKSHKKVIDTRPKVYTSEALDIRGKARRDRDTGQELRKVSTGFETVQEITVCGNCE